MEVFSCTQDAAANTWTLNADPGITCLDGGVQSQLVTFAAGTLVLYGAGVPILFGYVFKHGAITPICHYTVCIVPRPDVRGDCNWTGRRASRARTSRRSGTSSRRRRSSRVAPAAPRECTWGATRR